MTLVLQMIGVVVLVTIGFILWVIFWSVLLFGRPPKAPKPVEPPKPVYPPKPVDPPWPVYLRKWTAGRKLDATREQEQWQKLFDSSER